MWAIYTIAISRNSMIYPIYFKYFHYLIPYISSISTIYNIYFQNFHYLIPYISRTYISRISMI